MRHPGIDQTNADEDHSPGHSYDRRVAPGERKQPYASEIDDYSGGKVKTPNAGDERARGRARDK
jgi:hypothetical protein